MSALNEAFPSVEPGLIPFGSRVLVQIRSAKKTSSGGIILHSETRETEIWNTQIAKVVFADDKVKVHSTSTFETSISDIPRIEFE